MNFVIRDSICQNMRVLSEHRDTLPVKYVQIDEGWNTGWGPWEGETLFVATASPLADAHHADASVFLEKDGYTVYRVVPAREEYTLMLKS